MGTGLRGEGTVPKCRIIFILMEGNEVRKSAFDGFF